MVVPALVMDLPVHVWCVYADRLHPHPRRSQCTEIEPDIGQRESAHWPEPSRSGHPVTGLLETTADGLRVTLLFAAMDPIALASTEAEPVRVTVACSVG